MQGAFLLPERRKNMAQSLTAKAGIVTTDFGRGVQEIREKLKQLNTSLEENKQELKTAAKEANNLRKAQQELASQMENGGTDEQKRRNGTTVK